MKVVLRQIIAGGIGMVVLAGCVVVPPGPPGPPPPPVGVVSLDFVDGSGYHHHGWYDDHHVWHGGYYDEHHQFHGDPDDWHR